MSDAIEQAEAVLFEVMNDRGDQRWDSLHVGPMRDALAGLLAEHKRVVAERDRMAALRDQWQEVVTAPDFERAAEIAVRQYHEDACSYRGERDEALAVIERAKVEHGTAVRPPEAWDALDRILSGAPSDALRAVRAEAWSEGWAAAGAWEIAAPGSPYPWNPYREGADSE